MCCFENNRKNCMGIGIFQIAIGKLALGFSIYLLVAFYNDGNSNTIPIVLIVTSTFSILVAFSLFFGALKEKTALCKIWYYASILNAILMIIGICFMIMMNPPKAIANIVGLLLQVYFIALVKTYIEELEKKSIAPRTIDSNVPFETL